MSDALSAELHAGQPHASLGNQRHVFDRFVGAWDCDYTNYAEDGSVSTRYPGRVTFGWILDGRAMQDVWLGWPSDGKTVDPVVGTSIRFLDLTSGEWTVIWVLPQAGVITIVKGGVCGDRIVLRGEGDDRSLRRWSFNDIRPDSFIWRGERSTDGGATWKHLAEYRMERTVAERASTARGD